MKQGLLYEDDVRSVTKVVKACITKLNKEWIKASEQKQKEGLDAEAAAKSANHLPESNTQKGQSITPVHESSSSHQSYQSHQSHQSHHRSDSSTTNSRSAQQQSEAHNNQLHGRAGEVNGEFSRQDSSGYHSTSEGRSDGQVSSFSLIYSSISHHPISHKFGRHCNLDIKALCSSLYLIP